ncbi:MAG: PAS domain-containing protein, partial [Proteobacteria bacterium]|nr:PAS domain-containing protein [Pseudomonadota bacterium]
MMPEKKKKDGKKIDKKPRLLKATTVSRDITQRKEMDEKLKRASDELRATFDAMEDPVMLIDRDHRITRVNMATSKMLRLPFSEIIGKECFRLIHGTNCPL